MAVHIGRRELIVTFCGAVAAWPLAARAQQGDRVRRIGVLMWLNENDPGAKSDLSAFTQALADLGWTEGRNVRMDLRWYGDDTNRIRALAQELVGLQPEIILTDATPATVALHSGTSFVNRASMLVMDAGPDWPAPLAPSGGNISRTARDRLLNRQLLHRNSA